MGCFVHRASMGTFVSAGVGWKRGSGGGGWRPECLGSPCQEPEGRAIRRELSYADR